MKARIEIRLCEREEREREDKRKPCSFLSCLSAAVATRSQAGMRNKEEK